MARVQSAAFAATLLLAGTVALVGCGGKTTAATTSTGTTQVQTLPANAIRVHWKPKALVPAARGGRVCITTYKTGHTCTRYVAGEVPAAALKRALRLKGWVVVDSN